MLTFVKRHRSSWSEKNGSPLSQVMLPSGWKYRFIVGPRPFQ